MTGYAEIKVAGGDTSRPLNMTKRLDLIAKSVPVIGARILDAGCGAGEYVDALGAMGALVVGIEYLPEKVAKWAAIHPGDDRVREGDIGALPFAAESFDAVIMNEVLEHVPDERVALSEVRRVLRPGGVLLLFSPNRRYPFETHGVHSLRDGRAIAPLRTFLLPWLPLSVASRIVSFWARNYWPATLRRLLRDSGFQVVRHGYMWQTFENISGRQPTFIRMLAPVFRAAANAMERAPIIRTFGVSQVLVLKRT